MYRAVGRMRLKPGMEAKLKKEMAPYEQLKIPGFVSTLVYRMERSRITRRIAPVGSRGVVPHRPHTPLARRVS